MNYQTDQEGFWAGAFGDEYARRNSDPKLLASNIAFFATALRRTVNISSAIEFGPNIGLNLKALNQLLPNVSLDAVEINRTAVAALREWGGCKVHESSILSYEPSTGFDLTFTKGVLIHINPARLSQVYELLFSASKKYILNAKYYNPTPDEVTYRGHEARLFKHDF